jgi:serine/threonine protein kinase
MLATGTEVGNYRIEGVLGRGGMGVVYEAIQLSLTRTVALKVLAAELSDDSGFRDRFRREARTQAIIEHAHIVPIYEAGELEEGLYIAMRLVRGPNLKQVIAAGDLPPERALKILLAVGDALDVAHDAELIHRDIKPQNILIGRNDHAFLADFGLTKGKSDTGYTRTGQLMGTLDYVAPEQIKGELATSASDIYALAAVAYECLVGRPPFTRPTELATLYAHVSDPMRSRRRSLLRRRPRPRLRRRRRSCPSRSRPTRARRSWRR